MTIFRDTQDVIKIKCKICSLVFGVGDCTATGAAGTECYNTRKTCQALTAYNETTQDIYFSSCSARLPEVEGLLFPTLQSVGKKEIEINPGALTSNVSALGKSSEITITLLDHIHHDRGIDPYYATRPAAPQGTFWARWLKRNYYQGMEIYRYRVVDGVLSTTPELYFIQDISTSSGTISITAYDVMRRLQDVLVPAKSTGTLATDITDSQTVFTVTGGTYPASGTIVIGKEPMPYTLVGSVFTVVRGIDARAYSQGDLVQRALVYDDDRVDDVAYDLMFTEGLTDTSLVTFAEWQTEVNTYLPATKLTRTIGTPTPLKKILSQLSEQTLVDIYFDQDEQTIKLSAYKPGASVKTLTDDTGFTEAGLPIKRDDESRVNVVVVNYGKRNQLDNDDAENFAKTAITTADAEVILRYNNELKTRTINANWLSEDQNAQASYLGYLILQEGIEERTTLGFELEYKDSDLNIKDIVTVTHRELVDETGAPEPRTAIVVSKKEVEVGSRWQYKVVLSEYANINFGYIAPNDFTFDEMTETGDYDEMLAEFPDMDENFAPIYNFPYWTSAQKSLYVWLSDGSNNFDDGRAPYQLV